MKIKIGDTAYDASNGRTIEIVGKHFSDFDVRIHEDVYDEEHDNPIGERVTDAIFTQREINNLFGSGNHVTVDTEAEDIAREIRLSGSWDDYLCETNLRRTRKMFIKNREEIIEKLTEILKTSDIDRCKYQTDIYLYLDENGNGELSEFVNVGGNSWRDDDHITIYSIKECYDDIEDLYTSIDELCEAVGISTAEMLNTLANKFECEPEDIDYQDVKKHIIETYHDEIVQNYLSWRDDSAFEDQAIAIIEDAEEKAEQFGY